MLLYWKNNDIQHPAREEEEGYLGNSFSDFLDCVPRQHLMRQLFMFSKSLDPAEAVENIKKMNFIMVTEDFTEHLRRLGTVLQMDLSPYAEKSSYGAVNLTERERVRLAEVLEPEYALLRAVAPLAGVHLVGGRPMKTKQANASS